MGIFDFRDTEGSKEKIASQLEISGGSPVVGAEVTFQETGAGTYTGSVSVPAGATIVDVQVHGIALWTAGTAASMIVGDVADPNGFYEATDLKATDLLAGEANTFEHPGGKAGVYIASEQRVLYSANARVITGVITCTGTTASTGRTRLVVLWVKPKSSAAIKTA